MDFAASAFEIKELADGGAIEGLAAGFGDVDHGGDKILSGAFTKSLAARAGNPLPMLLCHDHRRPIGAWKSWEERPEGLFVKGNISLATRDGQEAHALARDGALTGISIGWKAASAPRFEGRVRLLPDVQLFEASLVPVPMHERTRITSVKGITGARDLEDLLHEAGFSGRKAKHAASIAWKTLNDSSDDDAAEAELASIVQASINRLSAKGGR